ncbi:MAG: capsid cement protein [Planctomycetota bacterium]
MTTFVAQLASDGDTVDYRPGADVAPGAVVVVGDLVGVTKRPIPANTLGALALTGVYEVPKDSTVDIPLGTLLYWDSTNQRVTPTVGSNKLFGRAVTAGPVGADRIQVRLEAR